MLLNMWCVFSLSVRKGNSFAKENRNCLLAWFFCNLAVGTKAAKNSKEELSTTWTVTVSFVVNKIL